jgi:hypothetical protein
VWAQVGVGLYTGVGLFTGVGVVGVGLYSDVHTGGSRLVHAGGSRVVHRWE